MFLCFFIHNNVHKTCTRIASSYSSKGKDVFRDIPICCMKNKLAAVMWNCAVKAVLWFYGLKESRIFEDRRKGRGIVCKAQAYCFFAEKIHFH